MIANVSKNNTGKLLVAIMAMFLVVVGATVVFSDNTSAAPEENNVAAIGEKEYVSLGAAIDEAQKTASTKPVTIKLLEDATIDASEDLTGITIECGANTLSITGNTTITNGTINGTGLGKTGSHQIVGTSGEVMFNGTTFNSNAAETSGNDVGKGAYAYFILTVSGTSATFTGCTFNTTQTGDWGVIYDGVSTLTLDDCDFNQTPKVNYTNTNGKVVLKNGTQINLQLTGTKTVDFANFEIDETSGLGNTYFGWGKNDSSYTGTENSNDVNVTFKDTRDEADKKPVDLGEFIPGDDPNSSGTQSAVVEESAKDTADYEAPVGEDGKGVGVTQKTESGELKVVEGVIDKNTEYTENVQFKNVTVNPGVILTLDGSNIFEVSGDFRLFGTINSKDSTNSVTINVPENATFTAYSGASFGKNVYLDGAGKIDVSAAMQDFEVNQNVIGDYTYPQFQRVIITDTLTIKSGVTMTVLGELVINEGVTLIVEAGAVLQIGDVKIEGNDDTNNITAVGVTVNGTIEIDEGATVNNVKVSAGQMNVVNAQNVTVAGQIVANGKLTIASNVAIKSGGSITVDDSDDSIITVTAGNNFVVETGGNLDIYGQMSISSISNKGTITLNEAVLAGSSTINMAADGAVVEIVSYTGTESYSLTITDKGMIAGKDENKQDVVIGASDCNNLYLHGNAGIGIEGLVITESVTSETINKKVVYTNTMYISGAVDVVDENDTNADYTIEVNGQTGIAIATEDSLVLGEGIVFQINGGKLTVDGAIDAIDATFVPKNNGNAESPSYASADVYVNGTITTSKEIAGDIMNAFHYSVKKTTSSDAYEVYTNLTNALANSQDIEYLGEVEILESVTIPAGTEIEAASGAKMTIGDSDHRDITVTFANGSTFRNGMSNVEVNATLVIENYKKDLKNTEPKSDVQIDEGDKRAYTNIYTALNVESGTVTIRQGTIVFLDDDIEVKSGVTLVIPATSSLYIDNGVVMTVNGTVENSGNIASMTPNPDETTATTTPYVDGDGFRPLDKDEVGDPATIVVNGAFKSMTFTAYDAYYIPGAYYQIIDTEGAWYWITPVEAAAAVAATAEDGVSIYGEVTVGDVAFNGTEDVTVEVTIMNGAELNAGTITLSRAVIGFEENGTGAFTGTIASAAGSVAFVNANGFTMADSVDQDDAETTSLVGTAKKAITNGADATVIVATGNITVDGLLNVNGVAFTIASGATVTVTGNNAELTTEGDEDNDKLSVDGTLVVTENGTVDVKILTVRGTLNVLPADRDNRVAAGKMEVETLYVGIALEKDTINKFGDASAGVVSADVTSKPTQIIVSSESTITGKLIEGMNSTEFFVEDALWITVYYNGTQNIYGNYVPADLNECEFKGWNDANGKLIDNETIGATIGAENYKQVYANINYNVYQVVITLDNTVGSVAIDGQMLVYNTQLGGYVLPNEQLLTAGQHTVTYTLTANYEGTPTLSSSTVQVSGMTFTLSGDYEDQNSTKDDKTINYYLSLGGATLADTSIVIDGGSGDDGMSLTDILLIVLVVLILVMAIIVALRLMRS